MSYFKGFIPAQNWWAIALFVSAIVWTVVWKGIALWRASHLNKKIWFVAFLILNTCGVLESIYLMATAEAGKKAKLIPPLVISVLLLGLSIYLFLRNLIIY